MMTSVLNPYKGPLTFGQATKGIELARANAASLIADAELLFENKRYASACALAILAIEELGKVKAIRHILLQSGTAALKDAWKGYRNHRNKNTHWILPELARAGAVTLEQVRSAADPDGEHTAVLDGLKQIAFYTDCYGTAGRWSVPRDAIEPELSASILATASMLSGNAVTTEREIELWVTIVGPHYAKISMVQALFEFQRQLYKEGLTATPPEELEAFVSAQPIGARE